jgi:hypothetical protein
LEGIEGRVFYVMEGNARIEGRVFYVMEGNARIEGNSSGSRGRKRGGIARVAIACYLICCRHP